MGGGISKHHEEVARSPALESVEKSPQSEQPTEGNNNTNKNKEESKCPMDRGDGSYSFDWTKLFQAAAAHGPKGSKPLSKYQQEDARNTSQTEGGCPVKHNQIEPSGCPVKGSAHPEYNVYSQPIDKTNQMPKGVKTQMPNYQQTTSISTNRVSSSIPKGGGSDDSNKSGTWTYPSPQQFYNALSRKGKLGDDTSEEDMESVVALHNNMNEKTWAEVVEWERQTYKESSSPKLLKFQGRPHDLSPKAALKHYVLGHPLPYDRHDWTVLRDNGSTVRYVIDYYYDETRALETEDSATPALHDRNATPSLLVDVRPALDGPSQLAARTFQMPYKLWNNQTTFTPLALRGTPELANQVKESIQVWQSIQALRQQDLKKEEESMEAMKISADQAKEIAVSFANVLKMCHAQQAKVEACNTEEECSKASMDLTMCMGPLLCQVQHKSLLKTLGEDDDAQIEAALETLTECVVFQDAQRQLAKQQHPALFKD
jgi:cytochrome c heme-lyase